MTEVVATPNISLADVYTSFLTSQLATRPVGATRRHKGDNPAEVERQCEEIDELWVELGLCMYKWREYPVEFIATRFCNLHYAKQPSVGNAYPLESVWQHIVKRIEERLYDKVVVMRFREHKPGRIYAWKA